jgi:hypothetical protein
MESGMLNRLAFANSLAVLTAALYVLFAILALVAPRVFQILFDAQFFGANVASLFPKFRPSHASLVTLVLMIGMSWVLGYAWAWLYNRFAKNAWANAQRNSNREGATMPRGRKSTVRYYFDSVTGSVIADAKEGVRVLQEIVPGA